MKFIDFCFEVLIPAVVKLQNIDKNNPMFDANQAASLIKDCESAVAISLHEKAQNVINAVYSNSPTKIIIERCEVLKAGIKHEMNQFGVLFPEKRQGFINAVFASGYENGK